MLKNIEHEKKEKILNNEKKKKNLKIGLIE